jgi:hypothetical protein
MLGGGGVQVCAESCVELKSKTIAELVNSQQWNLFVFILYLLLMNLVKLLLFSSAE